MESEVSLHSSRVTSHTVFHVGGASWSCAGSRNTFKVTDGLRIRIDNRHFNSKILSMTHVIPYSSVFLHSAVLNLNRGVGSEGCEPGFIAEGARHPKAPPISKITI